MLILILINVQYLQNVVFSFEKGLNGQNHSSSGSHHPTQKSPSKVSRSAPHSLTLLKTLETCIIFEFVFFSKIH